jgi:hypothetical protein
MLARLGDVLYWAGCLLASLLVAAAIAYYNFEDIKLFELLLVIVIAVIVWMIARACRYVLRALGTPRVDLPGPAWRLLPIVLLRPCAH